MWQKGRRERSRELEYFFADLGDLLTSGIDLGQALGHMQRTSRRFGARLSTMQAAIGQGQAVDAVFRAAGYPDLVIPFIQIGLVTGELGEALVRLSAFLGFRRKSRERMWKISAYPLLLVVLSLLTVYALAWQVMPGYLHFYQAMNLRAPGFVMVLIAGALAMVRILPCLFCGGAAAAAVLWFSRNRWLPAVEKMLLQRKWGEGLRILKAAQSFSTLSALLGAGVDLLSSLQVLAKTDTAHMRGEWVLVMDRIVKGSPLSSALQQSSHLPDLASDMILVAEQTGDLENGAKRLAVYFEHALERMVDRFFAVFAPVSLVLLGVVVGGATVMLLVPMTDLVKQLS